jgi:hypothetical protein
VKTAHSERFADYRNRHRGETVIVCGCGRSLALLEQPERFVTIGVNDIERRFTPDYLVVVNEPRQFDRERYVHVERSQAKAVFTQLDLPLKRVVRFRLGQRGGTEDTDPECLHYTNNSPYVAVNLARHFGARRVGLIGVDFTDDHFFARTGAHPLARQLAQIDEEYKKLRVACERMGIEIYNLSPISRLTAFRRLTLEAFSDTTRKDILPTSNAAELRIVSYATTPVAGVPAILARCIAARTSHQARCVWAQRSYANGVSFEGDIEWTQRPAEAAAALAEADIVIVHNGKVDQRHAALIRGKPVVTMAHNYIWNVDQTWVRQGFPGVVVGQYQATLPEFAGWHLVPNPIPFWEAAYQPERKADEITIAYTPSGRHESYPEGHRLYWHGKGYNTTIRIIDNLSRRYPVRIEAVRERLLTHAEALAAKRCAHIVVDECVTGSYHRNSLEGLACGCLVVNGVGLRAGVIQAFRDCAGGTTEVPFVQASRDTLEAVLSQLIESGASDLTAAGRSNRAWLETHWDFAAQWDRHWGAVIEQAINSAGVKGRMVNVQRVPTKRLDTPIAANVSVPAGGLSVVIPFGGRQRLGPLAATLCGLRQSTAVHQVIVAEVGKDSVALGLTRRWDVDHVFIASQDPFDKARAINTGSLLARQPELLWCDGDLLFGDDFLPRAQQELRDRELDFLFPFSRIEYLDDAQSREVCSGERSPADCRSVRVLRPIRGGAIGGAGLVRAQFLRRHGGMIEGFLGWGGEDNAWVHKATLVGRVGVTHYSDQVAWHLNHPGSGAAAQPWLGNPHYERNVELLGRIQRIRTAAELSRQFPQSERATPPWPSQARLAFVAAADTPDVSAISLATAWAQRLNQAYGTIVQVLRTDPADMAATLDGLCVDIVVGFADDAKACTKLAATLHERTAIIVPSGTDADVDWPAASAGACWILARTSEQIRRWRRRGLRVWHRAWGGPAQDAAGLVPVVVQPLSVLLGLRASAPQASSLSAASARIDIPVWSYWEGPMPDWIASCLETARRHAPSFRLLGPADFDALWDRDRDIDLSKLHVAHRSDFVRAFLLMRFGGLWIDADCIVMRDLSQLLGQLGEYEVIAHRERQGYFSNAFLAARLGSAVAARFYQAVCARLRARRPLSWIAIGNELLTEVLQNVRERCLQLRTEEVQPVCWSQPEAYFRQADDAEHSRVLEPTAWCYMLSQQNIIRHQNGAPGSMLTADRSFFSYLLRSSRIDTSAPQIVIHPHNLAQELGKKNPMSPARTVVTEAFARMRTEHLAQGHESISGPGSSMRQTKEIRRRLPLLLQHLAVSVLLDAPCGDFHWMAEVSLGVDTYIGIDLLEDLIQRNREKYSAPDRHFLELNLLEDGLPKADLVLCRDCLGHLSYEEIWRALGNFVASGSRYLLTTTFPGRTKNADIRTGGWRPVNLQAVPFSLPTPLMIMDEKCTESGGAFKDKSLGLWRLADVRLPGG